MVTTHINSHAKPKDLAATLCHQNGDKIIKRTFSIVNLLPPELFLLQ